MLLVTSCYRKELNIKSVDLLGLRGFTLLQEKHTESYRLILVGHSLGAGTAAILAMLLRPTYPDLFCYAFSPPGATLRYMLYI